MSWIDDEDYRALYRKNLVNQRGDRWQESIEVLDAYERLRDKLDTFTADAHNAEYFRAKLKEHFK